MEWPSHRTVSLILVGVYDTDSVASYRYREQESSGQRARSASRTISRFIRTARSPTSAHRHRGNFLLRSLTLRIEQ